MQDYVDIDRTSWEPYISIDPNADYQITIDRMGKTEVNKAFGTGKHIDYRLLSNDSAAADMIIRWYKNLKGLE